MKVFVEISLLMETHPHNTADNQVLIEYKLTHGGTNIFTSKTISSESKSQKAINN